MPPKKNNITVFLIIVLLLFNIILAGFLIFQHFQIDKENKTNEDFKSRLSELKNEITNLNAKLEAAKRTNDSINYNSGENVIKYQVKPGDTLKKIATEFYNDPEKVNLLIRFNNLKDEYDITTGQVIGIPTNN
jgi:LysM repeat protein